MNDQFLRELRRQPAPEFSRRLRAALEAGEGRDRANAFRLPRWLPVAASLALVGVAFAFPSVRAGAEAFLELFRIKNVIGVAVDPAPLQSLAAQGFDVATLLGASPDALEPAGGTVTLPTTSAAAEQVGFEPLEPAWRPVGLELSEIQVSGDVRASFAPRIESVRFVMDALGIDDLTMPAGLEDGEVMIHVPPMVVLGYGSLPGPQVDFAQARVPEVSLPDGLDVPALAEIALRVMGLDRKQAYDLAWTIDWRSTLLVPVPAGEAEFRKVNVAGSDGVAILPENGRSVIFWANGTEVFGMTGNLPLDQLLEMAQTAQ